MDKETELISADDTDLSIEQLDNISGGVNVALAAEMFKDLVDTIQTSDNSVLGKISKLF